MLLIQNNSSGFFEHFKYVKIRLRVWFKQSEAGEFQLKPKLSLCSHNAELQTKQQDKIYECLSLAITYKNQIFHRERNYIFQSYTLNNFKWALK